MDQNYIDIEISALQNHLDPNTDYGMEGDFFVYRVNSHYRTINTSTPFRFDGPCLYFCKQGEFRIMLNMQEVVIPESSITVIPSGNIIEFHPIPEKLDDPVDVTLVALSNDYLFDLKFDVSKILAQLPFEKIKSLNLDGRITPYVRLNDEERSIIEEHCNLLRNIYTSSLASKRESITLVMSSMQSIVGSIAASKIRDLAPANDEPPARTRSKTVLMDFMGLVRDNYEQERSVKFYADKMCLTPKYLSKLVKEASGHSASELIDNVVISRARHLLRYSDTAIKVIVAELNFPNQSSFNKFFKAKTGMTPLQYRNAK